MLKIYIEGMTNERCLPRVKAALGDLEGMHEIKEMNFAEKYVVVDCSTDKETLRAAISDEGYNVIKIEQN
ncbi:heavy-metal-associated domain-containing protein [Pectinatus frisingensis]|jgi:copper chaperone CopZ|uniref:heavy-metal-associated domain-containing protein n=1 Tax=Pectinatus frisingensis TaxID=865 RepID=UPI0015F555E0|nr:heavy metal-associated domain-containing protein [Pectinatus frisingensis]